MAQPIEQCSIPWVLLRAAHFSLAFAVSFLPKVASVVAAGVEQAGEHKSKGAEQIVHYEVKLAQQQQSTPQDKNSVAAEQAWQLLKEAERLRAQGTPGSLQQAIEKYKQALTLLKSVNGSLGRRGEAVTLFSIGRAYDSLGEKQKALDYYNSALPIRRAVGDRNDQAVTLNNIGKVYNDLSEKQKALDYYNQALPLDRAVGNRSVEATTLTNIGSVYSSLGEKQKALDHYNSALPRSRAVLDRSGEANTLYHIAGVERDRGNLNSARKQIKTTLVIVESLRTKIVSQELRASYFASVQDYDKFYTDLLMQLHQQNPKAGYDALALETSERARARSLVELLTEAKIDIRTGVAPALLERERTLQQQINARQTQLLNSPQSQQQVATLKRLDTLLSQYQELQAQIRQSSPRYAALTQPQPLTLAQMQLLLDSDTVLLEYLLGKDRSYLWAVTPTAIATYELPKQEEMEKAARQFYQLLTQGKRISNTIDKRVSRHHHVGLNKQQES